MKRRSIVLIVSILLLINSIVHASGLSRIQISMNGNKLSVLQAPIVMDGKKISNKIPSFVHNDRTLVHIRFIEENSDAKVTWNQDTKTVTVDYEGNQVELSIDSAIAKINGEKRILDKGSIPRLVKYEGEENSRTMVPLSFLAEALGFEVGWDYENNNAYINSNTEEENDEAEKPQKPEEPEDEIVEENIISSIGVYTGSTDKNKIIIKSDKTLSYTAEYIEESNKMVIDFKESKLQLKNTKDAPGAINVDDDFIKEVRYSQLSYDPDITRVVIDMKKYKKPTIIPRTDGTGLMISFESQNIKSITKELVGDKEAIVIEGAKKENMNIMKLHDPERLVIDLLDSTLDLDGKLYAEYPYDLGFIKGVRVSQFSIDNNYSVSDQIVRVVLDIKGEISDPNVKIDTLDGKIVIYPEKSLWENIEYVKGETNRLLTIENLVDTKYSLEYDNATKNLNITIPLENTELSSGLIIIKDGLIDEIEVTETEEAKKISIKFIKSIKYNLLSKEVDDKISLLIEKNNDLKPEDRLIVIDAGHGGHDPGAISVTKKKEKDFNLAVSKKFNERLKALGYNTIMTRETDVFIDLYERPRIANENYADIFVSIHANAHNNGDIAGVQMLYCPSYDSQVKDEDQYPFAEVMHNELLAGTGAYDRRIVKRPKLVVLRETKMPAVLVEAGFLSNSAEEKLLFTESYQDKIVDSMVKGVEKYFEMK